MGNSKKNEDQIILRQEEKAIKQQKKQEQKLIKQEKKQEKFDIKTDKMADKVRKYQNSEMLVNRIQSIPQNKIDDAIEKFKNFMGDSNEELTEENLKDRIGAIGVEVYRNYLQQIKEIYAPIEKEYLFDTGNRIRSFSIKRWVTDAEEQNLDKLINVYHVLSGEKCNIALCYQRSREHTDVSIVVANMDEEQSDPAIADNFLARLKDALQGNFPGVIIEEDQVCWLNSFLKTDLNSDVGKSVAIVSNVPSEKSEKFISQSMEKLLDGIMPKDENEEYSIILLASPVNDNAVLKDKLCSFYSELAPFSDYQITNSANVGSSLSESETLALNHSNTNNWGVHGGFEVFGGANYAHSYNYGKSFSDSISASVQLGKGEAKTHNFINYSVKHTLENIESQVKRVEESTALGMWQFAAYVISENPIVANNVAHTYLSLTQGEDSFLSTAKVNFWDGDYENESSNCILNSLIHMQHPGFSILPENQDDWKYYPPVIYPTTFITGKELARAMNFPRKSVQGLPVLEGVSFGREIHKYDEENCEDNGNNPSANEGRDDESIKIGNIYHMYRKNELDVTLDLNSLTSHMFVTGSTGTGKSNCIYQIINQLSEKSIPYLIVEPAKGEYKRVFGGCCKVFGTNITETDLLQLNPFSFPAEIHVLEHIDKLVEILNACWAMYAAMPAVLKKAVEKCYEKVGWNLIDSYSATRRFPTFFDLLEVLPEVINESQYSGDTKSDYAGALITRVEMLTGGLSGSVLCSTNEIPNDILFDSNVIVDLSRVSAPDTKSLLMGVIVMKLQEYRMAENRMNSELRHITILEEAHNLLRRTSISQAQENANLQGKSVEMITNSIAEMRTYGEGFVIVDQAPDLLDEAVIRNTNTKIVLRLPDEHDRKTVGLSMALNEKQINNLANLPKGVAAIYQNNWIEAVLCKFDKYKEEKPLKYNYSFSTELYAKYYSKLFDISNACELTDEEVDSLRKWISLLHNSENTKKRLLSVLEGKTIPEEEKHILAYNLFNGKKIDSILSNNSEIEIGLKKCDEHLKSFDGLNSDLLKNNVRNHILQFLINKFPEDNVAYCEKLKMRSGLL